MMKKLLVIIIICFPATFCFAQKAATIKSVLLEQLRKTHNKKDWFVPVNIAIEGLTAEQAMWKDNSGNHSVAQLVSHLIFWNDQQLAKFKGEKPGAFSGNNDETFAKVDKAGWAMAVKKLDEVLTQLEKVISEADESKLTTWYDTIANISTHNAYHTGQIIYSRKLHGTWDPEKGVK